MGGKRANGGQELIRGNLPRLPLEHVPAVDVLVDDAQQMEKVCAAQVNRGGGDEDGELGNLAEQGAQLERLAPGFRR